LLMHMQFYTTNSFDDLVCSFKSENFNPWELLGASDNESTSSNLHF
jgi:hypothetical protein